MPICCEPPNARSSLALIACGTALIIVPLLLTLYFSVFDEKLILFPPRGYTLAWYAAIVPNFGKAAMSPA